jgi:geranylgeranyl reductase
MQYDIVIVGAGPAGSNLARLIGNQYKVLVIDKRSLTSSTPTRIQKCCGGLLAPDAQKMMAKLGLGIPKSILVDPQLFSVKTIDLMANVERNYQRFYYNMDREAFDRWLVSLIPSTVKIHSSCIFKGYEPVRGGYEIHYTSHGQPQKTTTKVLVGADGAMSSIRKSLKSTSNSPKPYIAIQEWFEAPTYTPHFTAIFDETISNFYSWIIPKGHHLLLGSALDPNNSPWEKYNELKEKLRQYSFDLSKHIKTEGAFIYRTQHINQLNWGEKDIALIGEAAGAISPSSAEGISYALKTSLYLANSLEYGLDNFTSHYVNQAKSLKLNLALKQLKSPTMYYPPLRKLIMASGMTSIK